MKTLAFILSIYIFALNLTPCEDNSVLDSDVQTEVSQPADNDHQHQGRDLCSPFCICQCCQISAMQFRLVNVEYDLSYISTQDFFFLNGIEKDFTTSILEPPQA